MSAENQNIIVYEDGEIELKVSVKQDTIWLTQKQIAELFEVTKQNYGKSSFFRDIPGAAHLDFILFFQLSPGGTASASPRGTLCYRHRLHSGSALAGSGPYRPCHGLRSCGAAGDCEEPLGRSLSFPRREPLLLSGIARSHERPRRF